MLRASLFGSMDSTRNFKEFYFLERNAIARLVCRTGNRMNYSLTCQPDMSNILEWPNEKLLRRTFPVIPFLRGKLAVRYGKLELQIHSMAVEGC